MDNVAILGFASSVITELFMFVPFLRKNSLTAAITAIIVLLALSYFSAGKLTIDGFAMALVFALTSYKAIVQPFTKTVGLVTQE